MSCVSALLWWRYANADRRANVTVQMARALRGFRPDVVYVHSIAVGCADATTPYRTVTFRDINPTRFVAHVENAIAPFFLVFSESFDASWKARILNGGVAALARTGTTHRRC
jgi:hypothetical protein